MIGTTFGNSASSGGGFLPSDITGLKLWLDADAAYINSGSPSDADPVSTWTNKGTGTLNGTQSTAIAQPIWKSSGFGTNSKPYLDFDGTNSFLTLGTEYSKLPNHTVFIVVSTDVVGRGFPIAEYNSGGQALSTGLTYELFTANEFRGVIGNTTAATFMSSVSVQVFAINTPLIFSGQFTDGASSHVMKANGVNLTLNNSGTATNILDPASKSPMSIGRAGDFDGLYFNGKIAEIVVFDSVLSTDDIASMETYLNDKYAAY